MALLSSKSIFYYMRMTVKHIPAREIYNKWGRKEFMACSYYTYISELYESDYGIMEHKKTLRTMIEDRRIVRTRGEQGERIAATDKFRLSGKAIQELKWIIEEENIELLDIDFADIAIDKLVDK